MPAATIYKLLTRAEWEAARADGVYRGSAHDARDGFIHFSTAAQLEGTARKYFAGVADLVLLAVKVENLAKAPSPCPSPHGERERLNSPQALIEGPQPTPSPPGGEGRGEGGLLRWEPARDGSLFPHLYADLPAAAVRAITPIPLDADGIPILPKELAS
jgi:uncharacterized protein (DUF952 family)